MTWSAALPVTRLIESSKECMTLLFTMPMDTMAATPEADARHGHERVDLLEPDALEADVTEQVADVHVDCASGSSPNQCCRP